MNIQQENQRACDLLRQGHVFDACEIFEEIVMTTGPESSPAYSNWLLAQQYRDDIDHRGLYIDHQRYQRKHAVNDRDVLSFPNEPDRKKKLRIGFVSPDFYAHSVFFFLNGLFEHYDREQFEFICFSDRDPKKEDRQTDVLKNNVDEFYRIHGLEMEFVNNYVISKNIDILIDLAGHTAQNRLPVFIRRAAPVQVTWLGYPDTTGLNNMDWRITDTYAPTYHYHTEREILLHPFICYTPEPSWDRIHIRNSLTEGKTVFGTFSEPSKFSPTILRLWSDILEAVPNSEMVFKCRSGSDPEMQKRFLERLEKQGMPMDRVKLLGFVPSNLTHMASYNSIDIALDTYPYNGTTTTCEALWMGVPVVTMVDEPGARHCAQVGRALLEAAGLPELVTRSESGYLIKAMELAENREKLLEMKQGLRQKIKDSDLCNAPKFAEKFGKFLRHAWGEWCGRMRKVR
jgi:predicted O-linked N-acetylglucosamine transferase (SPINDLY family)